ncbi:MAG: MBL fold metallo-hydrolase [Halothiobacillus sp.]
MQSKSSALLPRRRFLQTVGTAAGFAVLPLAYASRVFAEENLVISGPKVPDIVATKLDEQVYCVISPWGFPSAENQGMMSNVTFITTQKGVVVIDSGASRHIGEMALRQIRKITQSPIAAVINTHYHGDHWLGNHAFVNENPDVPIYAHEKTLLAIKTGQGQFWTHLMERSTDNATLGTVVTPPNKIVAHGDVLDFGDTQIKVHFYGTAHTPSDISLELVGRKIVHVGDIAMDNRIAFMDDGGFRGTFKNYDALEAAVPDALWVPAHGNPGKQVLARNREVFEGIYQSAEKAVREMSGQEGAKALALDDPRVKKYAPITKGFDENIGKYSALAYLEAESASF